MGRMKEQMLDTMTPQEQARQAEYQKQRDEWKQQQIEYTIQRLKKMIDNWTGERTYTLAMMEDIVRCLENGDLLSQVEIDWLNNKV